jgi:acetylornithine/N-succinyldiaminopimelate aminotransferase
MNNYLTIFARMNIRQQFFKHLAQTSQTPPALDIVRAEGSFLFDSDEKKYLDFISGIAVSSFGHGNKRISDAIHKQVDAHLHLMVYGEYIVTPQVKLVSMLAGILPSNLQSVYLTNSGAEATEGAMKLAKRCTGRPNFVSYRNSYHGSTQGALSLCGNEMLKDAFRPLLPGVKIASFNAEEELALIDEHTAAVFVEPIQAEAGIILPENNFLQKIRKRCTETGALLVFDEIQTGMGRTGSIFAFEQFDVVPDILLLGKAFGGGLPLGCFVSSNEIMSTLTHDPVLGHLTTSGGHPVSCAAAIEVIGMLKDTIIISGVREKEKILKENLSLFNLRGKGLMYCIQFDNEMINRKVIQRCFEMGLLTDWFLFAPDCLRIAPPLTISNEELKWGCEVIRDAAGAVGRSEKKEASH